VQAWENNKSDQLNLAHYQVPKVLPELKPYAILAADSSPLELSRHRAVELKAVSLSRVFTDYQIGEEKIERNIVDLEREDIASLSNPLLELEYAVTSDFAPNLTLIDGSLIRWQWEGLEKSTKEKLVMKYVQFLVESYQKGIPVLAVIDRSASKDVVEIINSKLEISNGGIVDEDLFQEVLRPGEFSPVFTADSPILKLDERYQVGYVYYKTESGERLAESGVLRIEFLLNQPLNDDTWVQLIDQTRKGKGYPFMIARAHDTCVVKRHDKLMLEQALVKYGRMSQKERMKQMG
jgi:hypothetical protein